MVVAGQLVTCVALTVVGARGVHTFVHAVVCQGTLISVCRKTQAHTIMYAGTTQQLDDVRARDPEWISENW